MLGSVGYFNFIDKNVTIGNIFSLNKIFVYLFKNKEHKIKPTFRQTN